MEEKLHCPAKTKMKALKFQQFCAKDEIMGHLHKWCWQLVIKGNETAQARLPERKH